MADKIKVVIRARPLNERESPYGEGWSFDKTSVTLYDPNKRQVIENLRFSFGTLRSLLLPSTVLRSL